MTFWRIDLHCHTRHSYDGWTRPEELVRRAREAGLTRICVTDHGTLKGAIEAREIDPELVIVGEEIRCADGTELIGIGLEREIRDGGGLVETAARIREQGALVYLPHPFAYLLRGKSRANAAIGLADIVEIFNPRAFRSAWNEQAEAAAREYGKPGAASSDAHFPWEIGRSYTEVPPFGSIAELAAGTHEARHSPDLRTGWTCHVLSTGWALARRPFLPATSGKLAETNS